MANPIDNGPRVGSNGVGGARPSQGVKSGNPAPADASGPGVGGTEAADTNVQSQRLQQVKESIDNTPEVDMERVEAIKQAIAEGRFPVDPKRIAEKFAELEGLLNG